MEIAIVFPRFSCMKSYRIVDLQNKASEVTFPSVLTGESLNGERFTLIRSIITDFFKNHFVLDHEEVS